MVPLEAGQQWAELPKCLVVTGGQATGTTALMTLKENVQKLKKKNKKPGISVTVPDICVYLIKCVCETCPLLLNNPQVGESGEQIC